VVNKSKRKKKRERRGLKKGMGFDAVHIAWSHVAKSSKFTGETTQEWEGKSRIVSVVTGEGAQKKKNLWTSPSRSRDKTPAERA